MLDVENESSIWMFDVSQGKYLGLLIRGKPEPILGDIKVAPRCRVGYRYPPSLEKFVFENLCI